MLKIIASAVNTRYTHSAAALACLKAYWQKIPNRPEIDIKEFYLSQTNETIISKLILAEPDILAFSVYIWSIERISVISNALKTALPNLVVIWGGPEVSYNSKELMYTGAAADYIVRGEGEITFSALLNALINGDSVCGIDGITYKRGNEVIYNPDRPLIENLDTLPSPFTEGLANSAQRFAHYEASRGCPSKCCYCLSSVQGKPRYFSLERVKKDLDYFFNSNYAQIRFSDRTFNHNKSRAEEIIRYICQNCKKQIEFHFEIQADYLSPDIIELFKQNRHISFHLEIGVQSTNEEALKAINRYYNLPVLKERVKALRKLPNVYLHLDLLGGIVKDTFKSFCKSFNDVFALRPHDIQISLVKVLKGTPYEKLVSEGLVFAMKNPPYTVLRTQTLSAAEAVAIQDMGKLVEGIYNGARFNSTVEFIVQKAFNGSAADFFIKLVEFWRENDFLFYGFTPENIAERLISFAKRACANKCGADFAANVTSASDAAFGAAAAPAAGTAAPASDAATAAAAPASSTAFAPAFSSAFIAAAKALSLHELILALKSVPTGKTEFCPQLGKIEKRHKYRLTTGLRAVWNSCDANKLFKAIKNAETPDIPAVNSFPMIYSIKAGPEICYLELPLYKAFTLALIQAKAPVLSFKGLWASLYPTMAAPDFNKTLDELISSGLIYEAAVLGRPRA